MLEAIDVDPREIPEAEKVELLKEGMAKTHPVGGTFLELSADGTFMLLRRPEKRARGRWRSADGSFALRLEGTREDGPPELPYRLYALDRETLVLQLAIPAQPEYRVFFHFTRSPWTIEDFKK